MNDGPEARERFEAGIDIAEISDVDTTASPAEQDWLTAEWYAAVEATAAADYAAPIAAGVPKRFAFIDAMRWAVTKIATSANTYEPDPDGMPAIIVPAIPIPPLADPFSWEWEPGDLVAFRLDNPRCWWQRSVAVPFLNPEAVERAEWFGEPLRLHATPMDWLRASGDGVVILDLSANLRWWFAGVKKLECPTERFAGWLRRTLEAPRLRAEINVAPSSSAQGRAA